MPIKYVEGDLFADLKNATAPTIIPHVCNDIGAWGAGFVVPLGRIFPVARESYLSWGNGKPTGNSSYKGGCWDNMLNRPDMFRLGHTQIIQVQDQPRVYVANMIAQHRVGGERPLRYKALVECLVSVAEDARGWAGSEIVAPMFGSGLAGGDWNFIEVLIDEIWVQAGINVTIYYLRDKLPSNWKPPVQHGKESSQA